jgi:NADH dehydrogenase
MSQKSKFYERKDLETAKRVLILGAGFGGLTAAKTLCSKLSKEAITQGKLEVLLVSKWNYHLFTPLLYQASTGMLNIDSIAQAIRPQARKSGFKFLEAEITAINVQSQEVYTEDYGSISYDYLIIALGSVKDESMLKGASQTSIPLKTLADGNKIHNRIIESFERVSALSSGPEREAYLNFVIIGGSTGAELGGSIIDYVTSIAPKDYPGIDARKDCNVYLIEAGERLFPAHDKSLSRIVYDSLKRRGIILTAVILRSTTRKRELCFRLALTLESPNSPGILSPDSLVGLSGGSCTFI